MEFYVSFNELHKYKELDHLPIYLFQLANGVGISVITLDIVGSSHAGKVQHHTVFSVTAVRIVIWPNIILHLGQTRTKRRSAVEVEATHHHKGGVDPTVQTVSRTYALCVFTQVHSPFT